MTTTNHTSPSGEELKPCPFCGSQHIKKVGYDQTNPGAVRCYTCYAETKSVESWNSRDASGAHANRANPIGEDAANGAIGEREAFEAWANGNGIDVRRGPYKDSGYLFLEGSRAWQAWQARAALTAEKVASEPRLCNLDASPWQCSNCYSGSGECTAQPAQTQVALTDERIRKIAEEHFWGGKCTTADDLEKAIVAALREASLAAQPVSGGKS